MQRIVHQVWLGHGRPRAEHLAWMKTWRTMNPTWEYRLWSESNLPTLVNAGAVLRAGETGTRLLAFVVDVARLEVLARFGGVYLDVDIKPIKPLDQWAAFGPWLAQEAPGRVGNGAMGFPAGHPLLWHAMAVLGRSVEDHRRMIDRAGPGLLQGLVSRYPDVRVFPACLTTTYYGQGHSEALFEHHHAGTWVRGRQGENREVWLANGAERVDPPVRIGGRLTTLTAEDLA
jgi:mannosyltransferase OCH1-like enzyme